MPTPDDTDQNTSTLDAGALLNVPRVVGVDPTDPEGTLPEDAVPNGLVVIIDRWPAFPTDGRIDRVEVFIVGIVDPVAVRSYGAGDAAPEFFIPVAAASLPAGPGFEIFYRVYAFNPTTSPRRRLTFAPPRVLERPSFLDASIWGYLSCQKHNPQDPQALFIWEGVRIAIEFDQRFQALDVIELEWQGWDSLNGSGSPLTPKHKFTKTLSSSDISNGRPLSIVVQPFVPFIEPMRDKDSANVSYRLVRNQATLYLSFPGLVKIDRVIPGQDAYCDNANWMK